MTAKAIGLHKLLKMCSLNESALISMLRAELRSEKKKLSGEDDGGGDFHVPFCSDAKLHVVGNGHLSDRTESRVLVAARRKRLYPLLTTGFLAWFDETKRATNEIVGLREGSIHNHLPIPDLQLVVKVDNLLCLAIGQNKYRLVYPYFSEKPILSEQWARVGLWLMAEALSEHSVVNMEVLDVLRGISYPGSRIFFKGDEDSLFINRYRYISQTWDNLRPDYGL